MCHTTARELEWLAVWQMVARGGWQMVEVAQLPRETINPGPSRAYAFCLLDPHDKLTFNQHMTPLLS